MTPMNKEDIWIMLPHMKDRLVMVVQDLVMEDMSQVKVAMKESIIEFQVFEI